MKKWLHSITNVHEYLDCNQFQSLSRLKVIIQKLRYVYSQQIIINYTWIKPQDKFSWTRQFIGLLEIVLLVIEKYICTVVVASVWQLRIIFISNVNTFENNLHLLVYTIKTISESQHKYQNSRHQISPEKYTENSEKKCQIKTLKY